MACRSEGALNAPPMAAGLAIDRSSQRKTTPPAIDSHPFITTSSIVP
ncbi:MAG: hypothetical protein JW986_06275 [Methanotrichaceae archaeon]|nr:hypothetical protein [Methanotrichaceae archaeon]